jgi:hypothetical protein
MSISFQIFYISKALAVWLLVENLIGKRSIKNYLQKREMSTIKEWKLFWSSLKWKKQHKMPILFPLYLVGRSPWQQYFFTMGVAVLQKGGHKEWKSKIWAPWRANKCFKANLTKNSIKSHCFYDFYINFFVFKKK